MNFNIEQIVIMVDSNIPGMEPFELTNRTFYHPELKSAQMHAFSKHPYFITERKYPKDKLYILARMSYKKILRFFFDKKYFETKLIGFFKQVDAREKEKEKEKTEETDEEKKKEKEDKRKKFDDIASHNVKIMIELLFPTTWPAVRNISDSHTEYILGKKDQGISFKDTVNQKVNFGFATKGTDITSGLFSYLKVDSKIYTISRVVWLNDLLNHPVYRKFIDNFINYSLWIERERDRMEILLESKNKKLFSRILDEGTVGANGNKKPHIDSLNIFDEEENFKANRVSLNQGKIDERKAWHKELEDLFTKHFENQTVSLPYTEDGEHFSTKSEDGVKQDKKDDTQFTVKMFLNAQNTLENKLDELPPPTLLSRNDEYLKVKKDKDNFERKFYDGVVEKLEKNVKKKDILEKIKELRKKIDDSRKLYPSTEESLDPSGRDFKKFQFYEDLNKLIIQMTNFKEQIKKEKEKNGSHDSNINTLFSLAKDLMDSYERLRQNDRVKLRGITDNFRIKLSKIVEEFKKLNVLEKIKTNYMSKGEINTKLEGEDPDVVAELKKDYSRLIEFIDKSKDLLEPKRESSNFDLQKTIVDYSENSKDSKKGDVLVFKELMDKVRTEMVFLRKDKTTDDEDKKLMRVGVCGVDKNKMDKPHYEVYVAIDVMEGEINANNLEGVKCKYRGLYLGRETENFFTKYNKFEVKQHRVYVPEKDEDERLPDEKELEADKDMVKEKEKEKEKDVGPEEKKKVNGGKPLKRSRKRHLNKSQSKRRSRTRRSNQ